MDSGKRPYIDLEVTPTYKIREFSTDVEVQELYWHRDNEDRTVEVLEVGSNWHFQRDNHLPEPLLPSTNIFIQRHEWHRVIKGSGKLLLKIYLDGEK